VPRIHLEQLLSCLGLAVSSHWALLSLYLLFIARLSFPSVIYSIPLIESHKPIKTSHSLIQSFEPLSMMSVSYEQWRSICLVHLIAFCFVFFDFLSHLLTELIPRKRKPILSSVLCCSLSSHLNILRVSVNVPRSRPGQANLSLSGQFPAHNRSQLRSRHTSHWDDIPLIIDLF